jgi:hypothetical protein
MEAIKNQFQQLGLMAGLVISTLFIGWFMLMNALGLGHISELRYVNFVFLLGGLAYVFHHFKQPDHNIEYLPGLGLGFITTTASIVPFAMFLYVYFSYLDAALLVQIKSSSALMGTYLTPFAIAGAVLMEGLAYGLIVSFVIMQYYKSGFEKHTRKFFARKTNREFINH